MDYGGGTHLLGTDPPVGPMPQVQHGTGGGVLGLT